MDLQRPGPGLRPRPLLPGGWTRNPGRTSLHGARRRTKPGVVWDGLAESALRERDGEMAQPDVPAQPRSRPDLRPHRDGVFPSLRLDLRVRRFFLPGAAPFHRRGWRSQPEKRRWTLLPGGVWAEGA